LIDTIRKSLDLVGRDQRRRWVIVAVLAIVSSVLEMLGAVLVYLLIGLISGTEMGVPLVGDLRALGGGLEDSTFLLVVAGVLAAFFIVRAVVQVGITYVKYRVAHSAGARLSSTLMAGYLRMPYGMHLRRNSAELIRNAYEAVEKLERQCFLQIIYAISEAALILGMLVVMAVVAPAATALAVVVVGLASLLLLKVVQPKLKRIGYTAQEMKKRNLASMQQSLQGIRDIKVLGIEESFARRYRKDRKRLSRVLYLQGTAAQLPRHVVETSLLGFILALFSISVAIGTATEELLAVLGLFAYAGLRLQPSLQRLIGSLNSIRFSSAAVEQVHDDLRLIEGLNALPPEDDEEITFDHLLRAEDLGFQYTGSDRPALTGIDLEIRPGEIIGICGPTGGGKTTLVDLIIGLIDPTHGDITVDGRSLVRHRAAWWRKLGVVPQMIFLTDDSLRRNIALGVEDEDIDEAAVERAVRLAQLDSYVDALPDGLDTTVGERGVRISGGQRQRIAIARALYRRPEVLIFDEGTSALDNATEAALMGALERLRGRHTIILVAHRLSTVRHADRIVYLENGGVSGYGSYASLLETNERFKALAADGYDR
jgi:ATP-binding cassette, subfamily B, bacterial PglK